MAVPSVTTAPRPATIDDGGIQAAIVAAGFPAGIDPSTLFQLTQLSAETPTVSHLLRSQGLHPYDSLGQSITAAIENLNLAAGRKVTLTSIRGDFLSVNPEMVQAAMADPAQRAAMITAFKNLSASLADKANEARAALPPPKAPATADSVEAPVPSITPPLTKGATLPAPTTQSATTQASLPLRDLPEHAALDGVSPRWRKWFARGEHAPQTLAILLHEQDTAAISQDLAGALDRVTAMYNIGQPGNENLEKTLLSLQEGLQPFGYSVQPEGQFGGATLAAWRGLVEQKKADPASVEAITNPVLRTLLRLKPAAAPADEEIVTPGQDLTQPTTLVQPDAQPDANAVVVPPSGFKKIAIAPAQ